MTNSKLARRLHDEAGELEKRLQYYRDKGEPEAVAILAEQAHDVRVRYLEAFGKSMTEGMEEKWTRTG